MFGTLKKKIRETNFFLKIMKFLEHFLENVYSIVFQNFIKFHQKLNEILQKIRKNFKLKICKHFILTETAHINIPNL